MSDVTSGRSLCWEWRPDTGDAEDGKTTSDASGRGTRASDAGLIFPDVYMELTIPSSKTDPFRNEIKPTIAASNDSAALYTQCSNFVTWIPTCPNTLPSSVLDNISRKNLPERTWFKNYSALHFPQAWAIAHRTDTAFVEGQQQVLQRWASRRSRFKHLAAENPTPIRPACSIQIGNAYCFPTGSRPPEIPTPDSRPKANPASTSAGGVTNRTAGLPRLLRHSLS